jgi:hypothetical protein
VLLSEKRKWFYVYANDAAEPEIKSVFLIKITRVSINKENGYVNSD